MKAGDAVFLALLSRVMDNTLALKYDLTAIFYDNEEVAADLNGLGILAAQRPDLLEGDFAILGEPTNALVEAGCNGSLRFDVVARGKAAHSARSWVGKNAIHKLQQVLAILNEWNDELHIVDVEGLKYIEGLNATKIGGGIATNVIPDEVKVHINYRFAPDKSLETAIANVLQWFEGFEVEIIDKSPAARPGTSLKEVQAFSSVAQKFNNKPIAPKYGWTDVARFSALGVPALNFGPGDALLAHHDEEEVEKSNIELCYNVLEEYLFSK
jgi:succinyl-diaminopimelate desuccinylase